MDTSVAYGSIGFGMVIGWVTYYTMRKNTQERTLADITVILSALVGPAVLAVFPAPQEGKQTMFGYYGIGLAIGFFAYYIVFVLLLWKSPDKLIRSVFSTSPTTGGAMRDKATKSKEDAALPPAPRPAVGDKGTTSPEG
jgi:hypothetical protein